MLATATPDALPVVHAVQPVVPAQSAPRSTWNVPAPSRRSRTAPVPAATPFTVSEGPVSTMSPAAGNRVSWTETAGLPASPASVVPP
ncbi:hypothetical protein D3C75_1205190 [compost metagenome]